MKKLIALLVVIAMFATMGMMASALDVDDDEGTAIISGTIGEVWSVTIPANLDLGDLAEISVLEDFGSVEVSGKLLEDTSLAIAITGDYELVNADSDSLEFDVVLANGDAIDDELDALVVDDEVELALDFTDSIDDIDDLPAGDYSGTLTFTVSVNP